MTMRTKKSMMTMRRNPTMRYEPHYHLLGLQLTIDRMTAGSQEKKKQLSANKAKLS